MPATISTSDLARALWHFHRVYAPLAPADAIVGLGSYDLRVAKHCAALLIAEQIGRAHV